MRIGIDIEDVKRFKKLIKSNSFLQRVFSGEEISYCFSKKNSAEHFAVRFAGKEAVWKALSGNKKILINDIFIKNTDFGKPEVYIKHKKVNYIDISFSHTKDTVVAVAISEK